jgi:hypothetical protein
MHWTNSAAFQLCYRRYLANVKAFTISWSPLLSVFTPFFVSTHVSVYLVSWICLFAGDTHIALFQSQHLSSLSLEKDAHIRTHIHIYYEWWERKNTFWRVSNTLRQHQQLMCSADSLSYTVYLIGTSTICISIHYDYQFIIFHHMSCTFIRITWLDVGLLTSVFTFQRPIDLHKYQ